MTDILSPAPHCLTMSQRAAGLVGIYSVWLQPVLLPSSEAEQTHRESPVLCLHNWKVQTKRKVSRVCFLHETVCNTISSPNTGYSTPGFLALLCFVSLKLTWHGSCGLGSRAGEGFAAVLLFARVGLSSAAERPA